MKKIYHAVIVDDEEKARKNLQHVLKHHDDFVIVAEAESADSGLLEINKHQPDLVFLDIKMPQQDGFYLLEELARTGPRRLEVIFLTAYNEYAIKAIKCAAFDYLLKPIDPDILAETLQRFRLSEAPAIEQRLNALRQGFVKPQTKLHFATATGGVFFYLHQIVYIEADGSYSRIYNEDNQQHLVSRNLKNIEMQLQGDGFLRVHKSFLINTHYLTSLEKDRHVVVLTYPAGRVEVPVSYRMAKNVAAFAKF